jgi:hypothetical protein
MGLLDGLAGAAFALVARYTPGVNRPVVVAAALAPYLAIGGPTAVPLFAFAHNWVGVVLAGMLTIGSVAVLWRWYVGERPDGGIRIRVVSANLRYGRADAAGEDYDKFWLGLITARVNVPGAATASKPRRTCSSFAGPCATDTVTSPRRRHTRPVSDSDHRALLAEVTLAS